jgi:hypothetical protein
MQSVLQPCQAAPPIGIRRVSGSRVLRFIKELANVVCDLRYQYLSPIIPNSRSGPHDPTLFPPSQAVSECFSPYMYLLKGLETTDSWVGSPLCQSQFECFDLTS